MSTPKVSVVMPVYNVEAFVSDAIAAVLNQTFTDFELVIVNDCATDRSIQICKQFRDSRIRIVSHLVNRGLAAARNTGIHNARGEYLAFIDSDDSWHKDKLKLHVEHLDNNPKVGISFSRSAFMDYEGHPINFYQMPQLNDINAAHLMCRNPVGNGSAPVVRRQALDDICFTGERMESYFDEKFRQSEDIECWLRIIATTDWEMSGLAEPLTLYRLNHGGLSSNLFKQLASWEDMIAKTRHYAPDLVAKHGKRARAYQLRYLARQAIRLGDGKTAVKLVNQAIATAPAIVYQEAGRTFSTFVAAYLQWMLPGFLYRTCEMLGQGFISWCQRRRIRRQGVNTSAF